MSTALSEYTNKKVVVVKKGENGDGVEVEGVVQSGNEQGLLIKPKGKTSFDIIAASDIDEVRVVPDAPKSLTRKTLKVVELSQARNHLVERHAFTLSQVNAMSDEQALETHNSIDHVASDLGHVHGEKGKKETSEGASEQG